MSQPCHLLLVTAGIGLGSSGQRVQTVFSGVAEESGAALRAFSQQLSGVLSPSPGSAGAARGSSPFPEGTKVFCSPGPRADGALWLPTTERLRE